MSHSGIHETEARIRTRDDKWHLNVYCVCVRKNVSSFSPALLVFAVACGILVSFWPFNRAVRTCTRSPSPRDCRPAHATSCTPRRITSQLCAIGVFYPRGPSPRGRRVQTIPRVSHTRIAHAKVHRAPCSPLSTFSARLYMAPKPPSPNPRFLRFHQLLYVRFFHR